MDGTRFDESAKELTGSRRTVLTSGAALALGGLHAARSPRTVRARKRSLKPAYTCPPSIDASQDYSDGTRVAQSFTATRSGTLRQIKIGIVKNPSGSGDYLVQVVRMDGTVPSNNAIDVIAAAVVPDAQVKTGETTLVVSFGTTRLTQGTEYAVVVSRPSGFALLHTGGETCEGRVFVASSTEAFSPTAATFRDVIVTVRVG